MAKLTLWGPDRQLIDRRTRTNAPVRGTNYPGLDVSEITAWLETGLQAFSRQGDIKVIIPVGHGAAGCIIDSDGLCIAPMDYEAEPPPEIRTQYQALRDPFSTTGSPPLPAALNLGLQLYWLETLAPSAMRRGRILPWPQYWAWLLSGVAASEVTSLGCHSDLWLPREGRPSALAVRRGWAQRLAPLRNAGDILGPVRECWRQRCSLPSDCVVLCGLHDSNAALLAARLYPEVGTRDSTLLSTGTWFVALRNGAKDFDLATLPGSRDCLVNVDISGSPVPSARFMGGREAEILEQAEAAPLDPAHKSKALLERAHALIAKGAMASPAIQPGTGPFGKNISRKIAWPEDQIGRRALAGLYLALMADATLNLIGAHEKLVVEGRFAGDPVFTSALASLRTDLEVYLSQDQNNLPFGALSLIDGALPRHASLTRAQPLAADLTDYARAWRSLAEAGAGA